MNICPKVQNQSSLLLGRMKKPKTAYTGGGWGGEGGELKQYSISVHYSGNINVNISPDTGRNDLARIESPKEVVNPNRPCALPGIYDWCTQCKNGKTETPVKHTIRFENNSI